MVIVGNNVPGSLLSLLSARNTAFASQRNYNKEKSSFLSFQPKFVSQRKTNHLPPPSSTMSDALGMFLHDLVSCTGKPGARISIISDNARRMQNSDFDCSSQRRRGVSRSASTPLNHMASRWESSSSFDSNISGTSPGRHRQAVNEQKSRWASESSSGFAPKLTRPKREHEKDLALLSPVHDTGKLRNKQSTSALKNLTKDRTIANLPKSLRSLPY
jgi:hypothetical protein